MYDLGIGTKAITFGKGAEHFGETGGKPVTGNFKANIKLFSGKGKLTANDIRFSDKFSKPAYKNQVYIS